MVLNDLTAFQYCVGLQGDFDQTPDSLRKPCNYKDGVDKHRCCAAFMHYLEILQRMSPPSEFATARDSLREQFLSGLMDLDLLHSVQSQVPPGDIKSVSAFRAFVAQIEASSRAAREQKDEQLARELRSADWNSLEAKLNADLHELMDKQPNSEAQAIQTAKDMQYLRNRQKRLH